jgi:DNA-binding transcriptional LysR family regulator
MASVSPVVSLLTVPFAEKYPRIRLSVVTLSAALILQGLDEFSLDVGVTMLDEKIVRNMQTAKLYDEEFQLLMHRGSRFSGRSTVSWDEVKELPLCLFTPESHFLGAEESEFLWATRQAPQIAASSILLLVDHVRTGHWASVVPRTIMPMIAHDPGLEAIPIPGKGERHEMGIVIPHRDPASPVAETFFEIATSTAVSQNIARSLGTRSRAVQKKIPA